MNRSIKKLIKKIKYEEEIEKLKTKVEDDSIALMK